MQADERIENAFNEPRLEAVVKNEEEEERESNKYASRERKKSEEEEGREFNKCASSEQGEKEILDIYRVMTRERVMNLS